MLKFRTSFITGLIVTVALLSACQSPSTPNSTVDPPEEVPGLTQDYSKLHPIGDYKTKPFDALRVDDGIVVMGSYSNTVNACEEMLFLLKLDFNGDKIWLKKISAITNVSGCDGGKLIETQDGGFLALITLRYGTSNFDFNVVKLTASGSLEWEKKITYTEYDFSFTGFEKPNGEIVLYPWIRNESGEYVTDSKHVLDTNGNTIYDGAHSDFSGVLNYSNPIMQTPKGNYIFYSNQNNEPLIKVVDPSMNELYSGVMPDEFRTINKPMDNSSGFIALESNGYLAKLNADFDLEWHSKIKSGILLAQLKKGLYASLNSNTSTGSGEENTMTLNFVEEGGNITATQEVDRSLVRKFLTIDANLAAIIYRDAGGVRIEAYSKED